MIVANNYNAYSACINSKESSISFNNNIKNSATVENKELTSIKPYSSNTKNESSRNEVPDIEEENEENDSDSRLNIDIDALFNTQLNSILNYCGYLNTVNYNYFPKASSKHLVYKVLRL